MEFLESILLDPSSVTFTVLFVGLFVYVTRRNEQREERYREREDSLLQMLDDCNQQKIALQQKKVRK